MGSESRLAAGCSAGERGPFRRNWLRISRQKEGPLVMEKTARIGLVVIGVPVAVAVSGAIVGTTTSVPVIEVTRETTATRERVWSFGPTC